MTQIKSKKRVVEFGEVYTNSREVNAMLDLVINETDRIDSRFLEPACGNGNFLEEILLRKLKVVAGRYKKSQLEYEKYTLLSVSTIYGIDILMDNCEESKQRLFKLVQKQYKRFFKEKANVEYLESIYYIIDKNIICGDSLTGLMNGETAKPIIFSEWSMLGNQVKRADYAMNDMLTYEMFDTVENKIIRPRKIYPLIHYREVKHLG